MRHRVAGRHLGRETSHRLALYRNLVTDLVRYERITTTEAKAKEIRPMAERMITFARRGDLAARRQVLRFVYDEKAVKHLFDEIAPRLKDRPGGYLRITKLEPRKGDGARMATIEFVDQPGGGTVTMPRPQRVTAAARTTVPAAPVAATAPAAAEVAEPVHTGAPEAQLWDEEPATATNDTEEAEAQEATAAEAEEDADSAGDAATAEERDGA